MPRVPPGASSSHTGTNGWAIASLICAFLVAPLGVAFGVVGLLQTQSRPQAGRGLAIAGIAVGGVFCLLYSVSIVNALSNVSAQPGY